jgi:hypothetical protein
VTLRLRAPVDVPHRHLTVRSNLGAARSVDATPEGTSVDRLLVCVPPGGAADLRLDVDGSSTIPGDQLTLAASLVPREGGVLVSGIFLGDETGGGCRPGSP